MYLERITDIKPSPYFPDTGELPTFSAPVTQQEFDAHLATHEADDRRNMELIERHLKNTDFFVETLPMTTRNVNLNDSEIAGDDFDENAQEGDYEEEYYADGDYADGDYADDGDYAEEGDFEEGEEEEDDISESRGLTPNFLIKHYKVNKIIKICSMQWVRFLDGGNTLSMVRFSNGI